jgi:hypothetical protein
MLEALALAIGFLGATLIGLAVSVEGLRRPRVLAIVGTMLTGVALILAILILLGVAK